MDEHPLPSLKIKPLNPGHLARLHASGDAKQFTRFQAMLLSGWLARLEKRFPEFLPSRSPRCLLALESDLPVAAVVARPYNRRGTCWSLHLPEQLSEPSHWHLRNIEHTLLNAALQLGSHNVSNWVIRCPATDTDIISILRELGFQPLRPLQSWQPKKPITEKFIQLPEGIIWQQINRLNSKRLWPIEQGGSFSHLRQITDRHWLDLLDSRGPGCGVLLAGDKALAGCIRLHQSHECYQLEFLRDTSWDSRLQEALPAMLQRILIEAKPEALITDLEDDPVASIMETQGWKRGIEHLLLGRSMWRRKTSPRNLDITRSLDNVFDQLRPQGPPIPNSSIGRR